MGALLNGFTDELVKMGRPRGMTRDPDAPAWQPRKPAPGQAKLQAALPRAAKKQRPAAPRAQAQAAPPALPGSPGWGQALGQAAQQAGPPPAVKSSGPSLMARGMEAVRRTGRVGQAMLQRANQAGDEAAFRRLEQRRGQSLVRNDANRAAARSPWNQATPQAKAAPAKSKPRRRRQKIQVGSLSQPSVDTGRPANTSLGSSPSQSAVPRTGQYKRPTYSSRGLLTPKQYERPQYVRGPGVGGPAKPAVAAKPSPTPKPAPVAKPAPMRSLGFGSAGKLRAPTYKPKSMA